MTTKEISHAILRAIDTLDYAVLANIAREQLGPAEVIKYRIEQKLELDEEDYKYILNNLQ